MSDDAPEQPRFAPPVTAPPPAPPAAPRPPAPPAWPPRRGDEYAAAAATAIGALTCVAALFLPTYAADETEVEGYRMIEDVVALLVVPSVLVLLYASGRFLLRSRAGGAVAIPTIVLALIGFFALSDPEMRQAYPGDGLEAVQPDPGPGLWVFGLGSALVLFGGMAMLFWSRRDPPAP